MDPGKGWDGKDRALLDGKLEGEKVVFTPPTGKRKYLAQSPAEFSATAKFPPEGHAEFTGVIAGETMTLKHSDSVLELKKITRKSPTAR